MASNAARHDAGGARCGRCRNDGCEATGGTSFGAPRRPITEAAILFRAQQPDHFLWRNNRSSWANAMSSCWEEGTQWIAQAAWCRTGSSPVQQATSSATIGSSIASNFAIDLKKLFSVQQRWRSAATQCSISGAFERSMAHGSEAAEALTPGQHRPSGIARAACPNSSQRTQ